MLDLALHVVCCPQGSISNGGLPVGGSDHFIASRRISSHDYPDQKHFVLVSGCCPYVPQDPIYLVTGLQAVHDLNIGKGVSLTNAGGR